MFGLGVGVGVGMVQSTTAMPVGDQYGGPMSAGAHTMLQLMRLPNSGQVR